MTERVFVGEWPNWPGGPPAPTAVLRGPRRMERDYLMPAADRGWREEAGYTSEINVDLRGSGCGGPGVAQHGYGRIGPGCRCQRTGHRRQHKRCLPER